LHNLTDERTMATSIAASWAWGVSLFVGMEVMKTRGMDVFAAWAAGNILALVVFGYVLSRLVPDMNSTSELTAKVPFYAVVAPIMQMVSALVNLTAIRTVLMMVGVSESWWPMIFAIIVIYVAIGGLPWVVASHRLQYIVWMMILVIGAFIGGEPNAIRFGWGEHWPWALWSIPMFFSGPFLDQQLWQRWFRAKTVGVWRKGAVLFGLYLALVGYVAIHGIPTVALATVGLLVATSTLQSAVEAIGSFAVTPSRRIIFIMVFTAAVYFVLMREIGLLAFWTAYASVRVWVALVVILMLRYRRS
jgi:hypothetical protein